MKVSRCCVVHVSQAAAFPKEPHHPKGRVAHVEKMEIKATVTLSPSLPPHATFSTLANQNAKPHCQAEVEVQSISKRLKLLPLYELKRSRKTLLSYETVLVSSPLKKKSCEMEEEVSCIATNGSSRRIDILAFSKTTKRGFIIVPASRYQRNVDQPEEVHQEKKDIY
ncbi:hypothetical protein ANN_10785 [Periplaneta americana]|uniref:Uncharacterized protein n=1 Tax=Periplaneta americana TaxID=6978 RepID=A0ABQ8T375_PERAM|nr:hypothetical protein ANN_10785 [Periplaneta americana]